MKRFDPDPFTRGDGDRLIQTLSVCWGASLLVSGLLTVFGFSFETAFTAVFGGTVAAYAPGLLISGRLLHMLLVTGGGLIVWAVTIIVKAWATAVV